MWAMWEDWAPHCGLMMGKLGWECRTHSEGPLRTVGRWDLMGRKNNPNQSLWWPARGQLWHMAMERVLVEWVNRCTFMNSLSYSLCIR